MITMSSEKPPVRQMIKNAVQDLKKKLKTDEGFPENIQFRTTHKEITQWIKEHYDNVNERTISAQIYACTVNSPSRINYEECNSNLANGDEIKSEQLWS